MDPTVVKTLSLSTSGVSFGEKRTHLTSGFVAMDAGRLWWRVSMAWLARGANIGAGRRERASAEDICRAQRS